MEEKKQKKTETAKRIVVPGEVLSEERKKLGSNVFIKNGKIISNALGLLNEGEEFISVVPLEGNYVPKEGDLIVGVISSEKHAGYTVSINSIYESFIPKRDIRDNLKAGTVISAKVMRVNEINEADLGNVRVFYGGELLKVGPVKVPRIIGKNSSMLTAIKDGTKTNLMVGRNGFIWANGGQLDLAVEAIRKIEKEAHLSNLTQKVTLFLAETNKGKPAKEKKEEVKA
jgi:exosome complex component RRP4